MKLLRGYHEDKYDVKSFVILDDENTSLGCFVGSNLVQTSQVKKNVMIKGHWKENTGLKYRHVRKAIKILNDN